MCVSVNWYFKLIIIIFQSVCLKLYYWGVLMRLIDEMKSKTRMSLRINVFYSLRLIWFYTNCPCLIDYCRSILLLEKVELRNGPTPKMVFNGSIFLLGKIDKVKKLCSDFRWTRTKRVFNGFSFFALYARLRRSSTP